MHDAVDQEVRSDLKRFDRLISTLFATNATYHNEKERMSHNIILLEMALLGAIITAHSWLSLSKLYYQTLSLIMFGAACILIHMNLRWQLRNRRSAAIHVAAIQNAMIKWVNAPPSPNEMTPQTQPSERPLLVLTWLDFFLPVECGLKVDSDASLPEGIVREIRKQTKTPLTGEWLVSVTSIFLLGTALIIFVLPSP